MRKKVYPNLLLFMPKPLSRREFVRKLRQLGFNGPWSGKRHEYMERNKVIALLPNPHGKDFSVGFIKEMLKQIGLTNEEFDAA